MRLNKAAQVRDNKRIGFMDSKHAKELLLKLAKKTKKNVTIHIDPRAVELLEKKVGKGSISSAIEALIMDFIEALNK